MASRRELRHVAWMRPHSVKTQIWHFKSFDEESLNQRGALVVAIRSCSHLAANVVFAEQNFGQGLQRFCRWLASRSRRLWILHRWIISLRRCLRCGRRNRFEFLGIRMAIGNQPYEPRKRLRTFCYPAGVIVRIFADDPSSGAQSIVNRAVAELLAQLRFDTVKRGSDFRNFHRRFFKLLCAPSSQDLPDCTFDCVEKRRSL